ncbi:response regulator transcription factor [bacterium]|nr:response regulator transcription factor [bacterium]
MATPRIQTTTPIARPPQRSFLLPVKTIKVGVKHRQPVIAEGICTLLQRSGNFEVYSIPPESTRLGGVQLQLVVAELTPESLQLVQQLALPGAFLIYKKPCQELVVQLLGLKLFALVDLSEPKDLLRGCASLLEGKNHIPPDLAVQLLRDGLGPPREVRLTTRQLDILLALQGPHRLSQIATDLQVTPNTLKSHLKYLYKKLNAKDRRQAVERARALDLLEEGPVAK